MLVRLAQPYSLGGGIAMKYSVRGCAGVLKETESLLAGCQHQSMKRKRSNKERDKAALAAVTKEMEQPRFAESARREEEAAGHHATNAKRKLG
jgi:hypothetical protein